MDARTFDRLDQHAMNQYLTLVRLSIKNARLAVNAYSNPASANSSIIKGRIADAVETVATDIGNQDEARLRIPWLKNKLRPLMNAALNPIGATDEQVGGVLQEFDSQEVHTSTIQTQALENLFEASGLGSLSGRDFSSRFEARNKPLVMASRIFKDYWKDTYSKTIENPAAQAALMDSPLLFAFDVGTDKDNMIVNVTGTSAAVAVFNEHKEKLVDDYIRKMVPKNVQAVAEQNRSGDPNDFWENQRNIWRDNNDLREYLDTEHGGEEFDPIDPTGMEQSTLDDNGIMHRETFFENNRDDAEREAYDDFVENIEWSEVGLDEDHERYIELVEDNDGDVDEADEWLAEERSNYETQYRDQGGLDDAVENWLENYWESRQHNSSHPYLYISELPVAWDEDGDVTETVEFKIQADDFDASYYVYIDGDWKDSYSSESDAWDDAAFDISSWFGETRKQPPVDAFMGPTDQAEVEAAVGQPDIKLPNLDILSSQLTDSIKGRDQETLELVQGFKDMVTINKKFGGKIDSERGQYYSSFYPDSPMHKDALWRVTALRYILSDAVRRGFGAIVWHDGLASSTRGGGGVGMSERTSVPKIEWSKETIEVGGKEQEVFVITSPDSDLMRPIVVNNANMIQVLGIHAAGVLRMQADGKWDAREKDVPAPVINLPFTADQIRAKENYAINEVMSDTTGRATYTVHDLLDNRFLGFYATRAEAEAYVNSPDSNLKTDREVLRLQNTIDRINAGAKKKDRTPKETDAIGKRTGQGVIFAEDVGSENLSILTGSRVRNYAHTFGVPTLAGARMNYEKLTVDAWNKELKKLGTQIQMSYIKVDSDKHKAYYEEGQTGRSVTSEDQRWVDTYGSVEIVQVTEPNQGFVVMSEVVGPIDNTIHTSYERAVNSIDILKRDMKGSREGSRVFTIVLNDQIKETYSKPIAPFHYDKRLDKHLKDAKSKFKDRKTTLADRFRRFRSRIKGSLQHEGVDSYYGLKDALRVSGAPDRSYMAARLSTGLEARVKAALYYGHPVWVEDTTQSEGKGLMEILGGISGDPQLWGQWMAGLRGKELMLEGYDNLTPEEQREVDLSVKDFDGDTTKEKIWSYLVARTKKDYGKFESMYALTDADREEMGEVAARFYENSLYHLRGRTVVYDDEGNVDKRFKGALKTEWQKRIARSGPVFDPREGRRQTEEENGDDSWDLKRQQMVWDLMDDPRIKDDQGRVLYRKSGKPKPGRYSKYEQANYYGIETEAEADQIITTFINKALDKEVAVTQVKSGARAHPVNSLVYMKGREKVFTPAELVALAELGDVYPSFERVRKEFAEYNSKLLDFAQEAGVINSETRPLWESEFYVPLYRIKDDRLGGAFGMNAGITDLSKPIKRLHGGPPTDPVANVTWFVARQGRIPSEAKKKDIKKAIDEGYIEIVPHPKKKVATVPQITEKGSEYMLAQGTNVGDILDNVMMNMTNLIDASVKNHAARMAVQDLKETGMIAKTPMDTSREPVAMSEVKKLLEEAGFDTSVLPEGMLDGVRKLMTIQPPTGPGVIDIMEDGKRQYYRTDNMMLYESLTQVNRKNYAENWKILTVPKRFFTGTITLSPAFMGANAFRDTISASISGRDEIIPFIDSMKGFVSALSEDEIMRTMTSGGASFEAGFITGGDTKATRRMIEKAMAKADFANTIANSPVKLAKVAALAAWEGYTTVGSSLENASRVAIYRAARKSGKSLLRSLYESKDIMDFSMRGNNAAIQFLVATVPFMGARIQGLYRTGRGFKDRPVATLIKGGLYMAAALAVWAQFREDERYKELEDWDKATYHHFWLGDNHVRLPRAFEVGALFTTIPEQWLEYMYSEEDDAGKLLLRQWAFMWGESFNMNPIPHTAKPIIEMMNNYNYFTQRDIVSPNDRRLPEDQFGPRTSETMRELAKIMPNVRVGQGAMNSPKQLENLYRGYTGTIGQYLLSATDWMIRQSMDYPLPPTPTPASHPLYGRFYKGSNPPPRTKYESEFYRMMEKVTSIQQSIGFYERTEIDDDRWDEILDTEAAYINVADDLEDIREDVRELNREEMEIDFDMKMEPDRKRFLIDEIIRERNGLFREAYGLRPGGEFNRTPEDAEADDKSLLNLIWEFGVNDSDLAKKRLNEEAPSTMEILETVRSNMERRNLESLAKSTGSIE